MNKTLHRVFAGNRHDYAEYLRLFERNHSDTRYITGPEQLRGIPMGSPIFFVGNFRDNKAFREVYEQVIVRDLRTIKVEF
jgi:hypothetical protein